MTRSIFSGMSILIDQQWVNDQAVVVEDQRIKAIVSENMIAHHLPAQQYVYSSDCYLIPGLIDLHVHGANGCDVMDANPNALTTMSRALAMEGVTGYLATTMTADASAIESVLDCVAQVMPGKQGAAILGVHLEGPFIAKSKMGAQHGEYTRDPSIDLFHHWQTIANNAIRLVTLAPELPGAMAFIAALCKMGVTVSVGHTNATYEQTQAAILAGCSQATHLFNAMSGLNHHEPGAALALLLSDNVSAELIADGHHVHPEMIKLAATVKGGNKLLLVTDAMRAKCRGDGEYDLGGQVVEVIANKATLKNGTLAGSTLRMPQAIKNMVQFSQCSLADAIHMASYNPAQCLGLIARKGSIAVGKDADLVVLNANFDVEMTMREGVKVA